MKQKALDNRKATRPYEDRPVGCPESPDLKAMNKEELLERRNTLSELQEFARKAEKGDREAVLALRNLLHENPNLAWQLTNLAWTAERSFVGKLSEDGNLARREAIERQLASMREEVAGETPSPLERLLAERVVATWLQIQLFEALYGHNMFKNLTICQGEYHQKRLDRAHRRHLSAIRTLAQVRKLLKPTVAQINIAEQQVNMVGSSTNETSEQVRSSRS